MPASEVNWPTRWDGSFVDAALEREFRADQTESLERFLGFSLTLTTVGFLAYGLHDAMLVPEVREQAWVVRYGVFLPIALLSLWAVRSGRSLRLGQSAVLAYGLAANLVAIYVGAIAPQ